MKKYTLTWLFLFIVVAFEYYALNFHPNLSLLLKLQHRGLIKDSIQITSAPGRAVSLWLGWLGLGLMLTMNVYSMRKRFGFMKQLGKLSSWLNFHVFCGLVGPTFILFHCNFKVRGIVGISFWSMVVSFTSGIIGRYFYVQMLKEKNNFEEESVRRTTQLDKLLEKINVSADVKNIYLENALVFVGGPSLAEINNIGPFAAMFKAVAGDLRLAISSPEKPANWPTGAEYLLAEYGLSKRRSLFLEPFQKLMGYWHTFHFPFAVFMYIAAIIHVAAALVFGV